MNEMISFSRHFVPARAPSIPEIPWVYDKSTLLPLVHKGAYLRTQNCTRDDVIPTSIPMTRAAQACIDTGAELTPGNGKELDRNTRNSVTIDHHEK